MRVSCGDDEARRGWKNLDFCTNLVLFIMQHSGRLSLLAGITVCISIFFYLLVPPARFPSRIPGLGDKSRCPHSPVIFHAVDRHQFLAFTRCCDSLLAALFIVLHSFTWIFWVSASGNLYRSDIGCHSHCLQALSSIVH